MKRARIPSRARSALVWMVLSFVLLQVGFVVVVDFCFPLFYDQESSARFHELQACSREEPERPLLVLLGSSRTCMCFRPDVVGALQPGPGPQPLVYNYSHLGAAPGFSLLQLQRLIKWGLKPRWVVVEVMPPLLSTEGTGMVAVGAVTSELPTLLRHTTRKRFVRNYVASRLLPWQKNRNALLLRLAPGWLDEATKAYLLQPLGPLGWDNRAWKYLPNETAMRRQLEVAREDYEPNLREFQIKRFLTRGLDDIVALCRHEQIEVVLLLTPESSAFRSWYAPGSDAQIQCCCADLTHRLGVPIIDARRWLPDEELYDGHHVTKHGAILFTHRLEQEVLRPLVGQGSSGFQPPPWLTASR